MKKINARGLACPAPVIETKTMIEKEHPSIIQVTVDNEAAKQNVCRFLESQKFETSVSQKENDFHIIGKLDKKTQIETSVIEEKETEQKKIMVMIATDRIGQGDDELGKKLMASFISTLKEMGEDLWRLVFVNNGVKLTIDDSAILPALKELEDNGTLILVCGTCLTHFDLLEKKEVGETTNMLDIVTSMQLANKVINI